MKYNIEFHIVLQIGNQIIGRKLPQFIILSPISRNISYLKQGFITADSFPSHSYTNKAFSLSHLKGLVSCLTRAIELILHWILSILAVLDYYCYKYSSKVLRLWKAETLGVLRHYFCTTTYCNNPHISNTSFPIDSVCCSEWLEEASPKQACRFSGKLSLIIPLMINSKAFLSCCHLKYCIEYICFSFLFDIKLLVLSIH